MGATSGTKGLGVFAEHHQRKEFRQTNRTDDIEGARSGSLKKAPTTKRMVNPLDPKYDEPGAKELSNTINPYSRTKSELGKQTIQQKTAE